MAIPDMPAQPSLRPAILTLAFRPFFLAGSPWAAIAIGLWTAMMAGWLVLPSRFGPLAWHMHEMLFGWIFTALAGFLLTAIPNWTGRAPVRGVALGALVILWVLGRLACLVSAIVPLWMAATVDVAFPVTLFLVAAHEIVAARNWRNLAMPVPVAVLALADLLTYRQLAGLAVAGPGWRLAIAATAILISVIGARIIPAFTRNWLTGHGAKSLSAASDTLDRIAAATLHAGLFAWAAVLAYARRAFSCSWP